MITGEHARPRSESDLAMTFLRGCILLSLVLNADSFNPGATAAVRVSMPSSTPFGPRGVLNSRQRSSGGNSNRRCCITCRRSTQVDSLHPDWRRRAGTVRREAGRLRSCVTINTTMSSSSIEHEHDHAIASRIAAPRHPLNVDSRSAAEGTANRGRRKTSARRQRIGQGLGEGGMTRGQLVQLGLAAAVVLGGSGIASAEVRAEVYAATSSAI